MPDFFCTAKTLGKMFQLQHRAKLIEVPTLEIWISWVFNFVTKIQFH